MHIKDFFNTIDHKFRNARVLDNNRVEADLINYANEVIGKLLYEIKEQKQVKGIECYIGAKNYTWGEPISDDVSETKTFPEILSIIRGLLESKTLVEIIDDHEAEKLIDKYKTLEKDFNTTSSVKTSKNTNLYRVQFDIAIDFKINANNMDDALTKALKNLDMPNNLKYKITKETVSKENK
jgi:hypothetical protein